MIRGRFIGSPLRPHAVVRGHLAIPSLGASGEIELLIDTGAAGTVLGPADAAAVGVDPAALPGREVGGAGRVGVVVADLTLGTRTLPLELWVLDAAGATPAAVQSIPSLLGRDILEHFALLVSRRTGRVLLLESADEDALGLP